LDDLESQTVTGDALMEQGLTVVLPRSPAAALVVYKKID
jgi:hypothetical protein